MGSIGSSSSPKTWIPYMNSRDCSQGFCSLYCPQWCHIIIPPPPSFNFAQDNSSSSPSLSPLVIAIIGILVSAFLLVSYYTIMSKYCGNGDRRRSRSREDHGQNEELEGTENRSLHEPWYVVTVGLDEALIKSLRVCKYKNGDDLIEGTDCAVCLSEFEEDENLRLLPKCNHAFHLPCIDTWLKSHLNCPLCRASVVSTNAPTHHQLPPAVTETPPSSSNEGGNVVMGTQVLERGHHPQNVAIVHGDVIPKTPLRASSGLGNSEERNTIIEIVADDPFHQTIRRSVSMDYICHDDRILVADIFRMNDEDEHVEGCPESESDEIAGSSTQSVAGGAGTPSLSKEHMGHVAIKRSFSSGRLFFTRPARARHSLIPL
ncbi:RING-H2 finger protein ATL52-like [Argentina anserina]|uniref:RING-H2 finger protein ATL52-like n=1 Tax=Argentina anserina TaxID=57926 RepID=UPI0021764BFA|nr:RING-H2 finger protein ATL52-like [Potentilla anserina]